MTPHHLHSPGAVTVLCLVITLLGANMGEGRPQRSLTYDVAKFKTCAGLTKVVYKGDTDYETIRKRISNPKFLAFKFPAAFGFPKSAQEAANLIRCGQQAGMQIAVRSGGHNYEGLSLTNGLVIDSRLMTTIKLFKIGTQNVVSVGAGQRIGPVNAKLWSSQKFVPTGVCDSVGLAGVTLGGGIGPHLRKLGLTSDSLVSAQLVTAAGKVLTLNATSNSDLFFAIRGGGGNYGLLTSMTYKLYNAPPKMSVMVVKWALSQDNMKAVTRAFFAWKPYTLPDAYSYVELFMGGSIQLVIYYWGAKADLQQLYNTNAMFKAGTGRTLDRLQETNYGLFVEYMMNPGRNIPLAQMTLDNVIKRSYDDNQGRPEYKASSAFLNKALNATSIAQLTTVLYNRRDKAWVQIHAMGGQVNRVAVGATAFPHRTTQYQLQINIYEYNEAWIKSVQAAIKPAATGLQYLNYIDADTANPWNAYFGSNAAKLQSIKQKWDPTNIFDAINQRN